MHRHKRKKEGHEQAHKRSASICVGVGLHHARPEYEEATDKHLEIVLPLEEGHSHKKARCDFWKNLWATP